LGEQFSENKTVDMHFANGPLFCSAKNERNQLLKMNLPECTVLGTYQSIKTDKSAKRGTPWTTHNAAVVAGTFGNGRIVVFGPHPEASGAAVRACIKPAVLWCSQNSPLRLGSEKQ